MHTRNPPQAQHRLWRSARQMAETLTEAVWARDGADALSQGLKRRAARRDVNKVARLRLGADQDQLMLCTARAWQPLEGALG